VPRPDPKRLATRLLVGLAVLSAVALAVHGPIPQDPAYHGFADAREWLGVPHFADVASNAAFVWAGMMGLLRLARRPAASLPRWQSRAGWLFAAAVLATGPGSAYYHWAPSDETLVWDRLPMSLAFGALFPLIVADRLGDAPGRRLFVPSVLIGVFSVVLWAITLRSMPGGDLRLYGFAQYFPGGAGVVLLLLLPPPPADRRLLWSGFAWYGLAKVFEAMDHVIHRSTDGVVAGHTLKHLAAAWAAWMLLRWTATREPYAGLPIRSPERGSQGARAT
jgi:hypothetical protein